MASGTIAASGHIPGRGLPIGKAVVRWKRMGPTQKDEVTTSIATPAQDVLDAGRAREGLMDLHRGAAWVSKDGINALALEGLYQDVRALAGRAIEPVRPLEVVGRLRSTGTGALSVTRALHDTSRGPVQISGCVDAAIRPGARSGAALDS